MNAALKTMFAFRQTGDVDVAGLKDASFGYRDLRKAARAFGGSILSWGIESRDEPATELHYFGEGVRFTALVDYAEYVSFLDLDRIRLKVCRPCLNPRSKQSVRRRFAKEPRSTERSFAMAVILRDLTAVGRGF